MVAAVPFVGYAAYAPAKVLSSLTLTLSLSLALSHAPAKVRSLSLSLSLSPRACQGGVPLAHGRAAQ